MGCDLLDPMYFIHSLELFIHFNYKQNKTKTLKMTPTLYQKWLKNKTFVSKKIKTALSLGYTRFRSNFIRMSLYKCIYFNQCVRDLYGPQQCRITQNFELFDKIWWLFLTKRWHNFGRCFWNWNNCLKAIACKAVDLFAENKINYVISMFCKVGLRTLNVRLGIHIVFKL